MAVAVAAILSLTLRPTSIPESAVARIGHHCLICGAHGTADAILNALLFLPLGMTLAAAGVRPQRVLIAVAALSLTIEIAQLGIPGRYSNLGDVVFNTGGGFAGTMLIAHANDLRAWSRRHRTGLAATLIALPLGVTAASAWLLLPAPPKATYYGQWTADLGNALGVYEGHILSARIGDQPAPSRRLSDSSAARRSILSGDAIDVTAIAGPPPPRLSPVFSLYDQQRREVLLLGAVDRDLVLRIRRNAARLRFAQPDLRWPGAFARVESGDTVRLSFWRSGPWSFCLAVERMPPHCGTTDARRGWTLLLAPGEGPAILMKVADIAWVGSSVAVFLLGIGLFAGPALRRSALGSRNSPSR